MCAETTKRDQGERGREGESEERRKNGDVLTQTKGKRISPERERGRDWPSAGILEHTTKKTRKKTNPGHKAIVRDRRADHNGDKEHDKRVHFRSLNGHRCCCLDGGQQRGNEACRQGLRVVWWQRGWRPTVKMCLLERIGAS